MEKKALFHIDIDSPKTLLRFWGREASADLDKFYDLAMERALKFFSDKNIPVTFFCVGQELDNSAAARRWVKEAFQKGHEIANHTYTHPYGFTALSDDAIKNEISRCAEAIERVVGQRPLGFRAPSYDVNANVINELEAMGYLYDTSATWNILLPMIKIYHKLFSKKSVSREFGSASFRVPEDPYMPDRKNWMSASHEPRKITELPITRSTRWNLPFYNNFHLSSGRFYRNCSFSWMNHRQIVYLMHLIEFVDMSDGLPQELAVHPNVQKSWSYKRAFLSETIDKIREKYEPAKTLEFVKSYAAS